MRTGRNKVFKLHSCYHTCKLCYNLLFAFTDQGTEKHEGAGTSGITDQEKELSSSALQAFQVRQSQTLRLLSHHITAKWACVIVFLVFLIQLQMH